MGTGSGETVVIPARFNGPPTSSNGGYACGVVAGLLGAAAADVTLRAPPPLETPLSVERDRGRISLHDRDTPVAEGVVIDRLELEVPEPVSTEEADAASLRYPWYEGHAFPTCFVCGPERPEGDGLRIFAGRVDGRELYASPWSPAREWAGPDGSVRPEIVWAALDCPSWAPTTEYAEPGGEKAMLARLQASLDAPIEPGERCTVIAWGLGQEQRKRHSGSAIVGSGGDVRARASALWIAVTG